MTRRVSFFLTKRDKNKKTEMSLFFQEGYLIGRQKKTPCKTGMLHDYANLVVLSAYQREIGVKTTWV